MGKYGKKSVVNNDPSKYIVGLLGEPGVGKTTTMCKVCDKLFGEDGYMILDMGKEDGMACLDGYTYETVNTFKASNRQEEEGIVGFTNIVNDIVEHKDTDYPNLKLLVADTIDQAFDLSEIYSILEWNAENKGAMNFKPAKTINGTWGGAGKNFSHVSNHVLNLIWKLKSVGVGFWYTGHVKQRQIDDVASGKSYTQLTTNMMQTYFNAIKTKTHILGIAYVDRNIIEENTGKKNMFTKEEIKKNVVSEETRKIKFRDDNYSLDSKSRFANIVDEIELDVDEFIKAIKDSIAAAQNGTAVPVVSKPTKTASPKPEPQEEETEDEELDVEETVDDTDIDEDVDVIEDDDVVEESKFDLAEIKKAFSKSESDVKLQIKEILAVHSSNKKLDGCDDEGLEEICEILGL